MVNVVYRFHRKWYFFLWLIKSILTYILHIKEDLICTATLHHSPRRRYSTYTFSAGWKEQVSLHPSSPPSTGEPLRACWPAVSLSGTGSVVQQTARPSSEQWTQLQRSSVPLSPPSWIFSLHDAPAKQIVSWRTPPIPPTVSSSSYHQEDSSPLRQAVRALNSTPPPPTPLWNPIQTPTSWNMDHHTTHSLHCMYPHVAGWQQSSTWLNFKKEKYFWPQTFE